MTSSTEPPKNARVTLYMPPGMLADLDVLRAELVREGLNVDRGQVIRAAITVASGNQDAWLRALREEDV